MYCVGQFGEVFCAVLQRGMANSFTVAVKTSKKSQSEKETTDFLREMSIMSQLRHPNIVQLHGVIQDGKSVLKHITLFVSVVEHHLTRGKWKRCRHQYRKANHSTWLLADWLLQGWNVGLLKKKDAFSSSAAA